MDVEEERVVHSQPESSIGCSSDCHECPPRSKLGTDSHEDEGVGMNGFRLALAAAGFFVAPVLLAVCGAVVGGGGAVDQLFGAALGFALGMVASVVGVNIVSRRRRARP